MNSVVGYVIIVVGSFHDKIFSTKLEAEEYCRIKFPNYKCSIGVVYYA